MRCVVTHRTGDHEVDVDTLLSGLGLFFQLMWEVKSSPAVAVVEKHHLGPAFLQSLAVGEFDPSGEPPVSPHDIVDAVTHGLLRPVPKRDMTAPRSSSFTAVDARDGAVYRIGHAGQADPEMSDASKWRWERTGLMTTSLPCLSCADVVLEVLPPCVGDRHVGPLVEATVLGEVSARRVAAA